MQLLHFVADLNDLADDLMTKIGVFVGGKGSGSNTQIAIGINQMQVTPTNPSQTIAHPHPTGSRQWLSWQVLHLQGSKGGKIGPMPKRTKQFRRDQTLQAEFQG